MTRLLWLVAFVATLAAIAIPSATAADEPNQVAEICPQAISFDMSVAHLSGAEVTEGNPAYMGEVIRYSVTVCPAMIWTDNYGNAKWGTAYFDRGIDQPTHQWRVTLQDGSVQEKTVWVASSSPPPPPPPPPSHDDITCCFSHEGGGVGEVMSISEARLYMTLPLNFTAGGSGGLNTCWRAVDPTSPTRKPLSVKQGRLAYYRKHMQIARWCAVKGQRIVGSSVTPDWDTGALVSFQAKNAYITGGGNGATMVKWYSKVDFNLFPGFSMGLWIEGIYNHYGQFGIQRAGST
jgi:hypothetical protein